MGMYDTYRRMSIEALVWDTQQRVDQYTAEYQTWMAELDEDMNQMRRSGYDGEVQIAATRERLYAFYAERVAALQAEIDSQIPTINQEYDQKEQDYAASFGALRNAPNATPQSSIIDVSAPDFVPSSYLTGGSRDWSVSEEDEPNAPDESWISRAAAWFR